MNHIMGKTRNQSFNLVGKMIGTLMNLLSEDGSILIEEFDYQSYFFPGFTSSLVFYGLKLINLLKLDLSMILKEIVPGLEVSFFHQNQLEKILKRYGTVYMINYYSWKPSNLRRLFFMRKEGRIT